MWLAPMEEIRKRGTEYQAASGGGFPWYASKVDLDPVIHSNFLLSDSIDSRHTDGTLAGGQKLR